MDSTNTLGKSPQTLDSSSSSVSKTLEQIHGTDVSFVMWNDQPAPSGSTKGPSAHAKGVLAFTSSGGFWLTHSLPKFPSKTASMWSDASDDFGQSFLCITLSAEEIHKLSPVMKINRPTVYNSKFATGATEAFADIKAWAIDHEHDNHTMTTTVIIKSKGGQAFQFFGKSGNWGKGKDLYHDLVAPSTGALDMEGWRRGAGVWGPACGKDQVLDITAVSFPGKDWPTTDDHSKWAVGKTSTTFCVGDINRADGQAERGGGTVCISDSSLAHQMQQVINTTDSCRSRIMHI